MTARHTNHQFLKTRKSWPERNKIFYRASPRVESGVRSRSIIFLRKKVWLTSFKVRQHSSSMSFKMYFQASSYNMWKKIRQRCCRAILGRGNRIMTLFYSEIDIFMTYWRGWISRFGYNYRFLTLCIFNKPAQVHKVSIWLSQAGVWVGTCHSRCPAKLSGAVCSLIQSIFYLPTTP